MVKKTDHNHFSGIFIDKKQKNKLAGWRKHSRKTTTCTVRLYLSQSLSQILKKSFFYDIINFMKKRNTLLFVAIVALSLSLGCGYYALQVPFPKKVYEGAPSDMVLNIRTSANLEDATSKKELPASPADFDAAAQEYFKTYFEKSGLFKEVHSESSGDIELQLVIVKIRNNIKGFEGLRSMSNTFNTEISVNYFIINKVNPDSSTEGSLKGLGYIKLNGPATIADYQNAHSQAFSMIADELYDVMLKSIDNSLPAGQIEKDKDGWELLPSR